MPERTAHRLRPRARSPSRRARTSLAAPGAGRPTRRTIATRRGVAHGTWLRQLGPTHRLRASVGARSPPQMRAHGARVGLGEVLAAAARAGRGRRRRPRPRSFFALRAALCSTRAEMIAFAGRVHRGVRRRARRATRSTSWGRSPSRRCRGSRVPPQGDEAPAADLTPAPAAWSEEELLREKDFAAYTDAERAVARRLLRADRAARAEAPLAAHGADQAPARGARPARDVRASLRTRRRAARAPLPRAGRRGRGGSC